MLPTRINRSLSFVASLTGSQQMGWSASHTYFTNIATVGTATNVVVTDTLPANLTFLSTPSSGLGCSGSGQTFTCSIGNLTAGGQGYADFVVTVGAGSGTFTNIATATYSGPAGALEARGPASEPGRGLGDHQAGEVTAALSRAAAGAQPRAGSASTACGIRAAQRRRSRVSARRSSRRLARPLSRSAGGCAFVRRP